MATYKRRWITSSSTKRDDRLQHEEHPNTEKQDKRILPMDYGRCIQTVSVLDLLASSLAVSVSSNNTEEHNVCDYNNPIIFPLLNDREAQFSRNKNRRKKIGSSAAAGYKLDVHSIKSTVVGTRLAKKITSSNITQAKNHHESKKSVSAQTKTGGLDALILEMEDIRLNPLTISAANNRSTSSVSSSHECDNADANANDSNWLVDDTIAHSLAADHHAGVIMTNNAFQSMLMGDHHSFASNNTNTTTTAQWKIPMTIIKYPFRETNVKNEEDKARSKKRRHNDDIFHGLVIVDDAVPSPLTSRECLSKGLEKPFDNVLLDSEVITQIPPTLLEGDIKKTRAIDDKKTKVLQGHTTIQYVYTLLSLPTANTNAGKRKGMSNFCNILVRTENDMWENVNINSNVSSGDSVINVPIRRMIQTDYFYAERKMVETCSFHQRAIWILEKLLQPKCRILMGRMNAATCRLMKIEEKGIAHALSCPNFDPDVYFGIVERIVSSISKVRLSFGSYMLCFPGLEKAPVAAAGRNVGDDNPGISRSAMTTVSVHVGIDSSSTATLTTTPVVVLDMEKELCKAEDVILNKTSLLSCFRMWEWDDNAAAAIGNDKEDTQNVSINDNGKQKKTNSSKVGSAVTLESCGENSKQRRVPFTFPIQE